MHATHEKGSELCVETLTFNALAAQYKDTVFRVALNALGNPADAEDAVQEVFLKLYLEQKKFSSTEHVRNWLIRVTLNHCKNARRSFWHHRTVPMEEWVASMPFERPEDSELLACVMTLPAKYRTVLYLFYYEDYSVQEIADLLNLKVSAVTTRMSRARKQLKFLWMEGES